MKINLAEINLINARRENNRKQNNKLDFVVIIVVIEYNFISSSFCCCCYICNNYETNIENCISFFLSFYLFVLFCLVNKFTY